ncbi:MAG: hypothetical protein M3314_07685, partial [Actinomycetota bacterium]|nr:hypothetical protein [Actinomycetota bacterium]
MANMTRRRPPKADKAPKKPKGDDKGPSPEGGGDHQAEMRKKGLWFCIGALPVLIAFYATLLWW